MRRHSARGALAAGALLCVLALEGAHGKDKDNDLFDQVAVHHFRVPPPSEQTAIRHAATAPSLHQLEMKAVGKVRTVVRERELAAREAVRRVNPTPMTKRAEDSLLHDAVKEMKTEDSSLDRYSHQSMNGEGANNAMNRLAIDHDHGHVPANIVKEAMKLAEQRDGISGVQPEQHETAKTRLSTRAEKNLLAKAIKDQEADKVKADRYDRSTMQNHELDSKEAVDEDHGHVPLSYIKLAEKLAKEQDQSMQEEDAASTKLVSWKEKAEDQMHGKVPAWQIALMKKAQEDRQKDAQKLEEPLAEAMVKEGYLKDKRGSEDDRMTKFALDHTKIDSRLQSYIKEAKMAEQGREKDFVKHEKPLANEMVKEGFMTAKKPKANMHAVAKDTTTLQKTGGNNYILEAREAEQDREHDAQKVEKPLADEMVKQGYLKDEQAIARQQQKMKTLAEDHTKFSKNDLKAVTKELVKEAHMKAKKPKANMHAVAKDTTTLQKMGGIDYISEAREAEQDREHDAQKVEKPLADEMVKEGYLSPNPADRRAKIKSLAEDHTQVAGIDMKEMAKLKNKAKLHGYRPKKINMADRAIDHTKMVLPVGAQHLQKEASPEGKHSQQLHHAPTRDYVKEAMQAQEQKNKDDMKEQKPLADAMVAQGYLRNKNGVSMADRAVDHTQIVVSSMKEVKQFTGAAHESKKAIPAVSNGQQLHASTQDYIKEAMQAQAQKKMDDMKVEKPLADAMVAQGYLRNKKGMADRAVDHTQIVVSSMKEVKQFAGAAHESKKAIPAVSNGQQLHHASTQDYIKEAMQAQAQKKMDDMEMQKPLADAMVAQGYLRNKVAMADRAIDHTSPSVRAAAAMAAGHTKMPAFQNGGNQRQVGQTLQTTDRAQRIARGQADFLKDAMHAKAMKDYEDAKVQAPLAKEMIKQGFLRPRKVIQPPVVHRAVSKPVARTAVHVASKLAPKAASSPKEDEAKRLYSIVNRGVYHGKDSARADHMTTGHMTTQMKQAKLLNLAMKAEQDKESEDAEMAKSISRDIHAEQTSTTITALTSKRTSLHNKLIESAIKEQQAERAKGEATKRVDFAALARAEKGVKAPQAPRETLFKQAVKEVSQDSPKSEAEQHAQMMSSAQDKLVQQAIRARDSAMNRDMTEEDHDSSMSVGVSKASSGETTSLIKLARQAMGEIDEEQEAKQARQRQDDKAEEVVHKEHVEAREKQQLDSEMSMSAQQPESRNSMLMLVREAESEVSKDATLAKPH